MRALAGIVLVLAVLYCWWAFPEGKSGPGGSYQDGGPAANTMNPITVLADKNLRAGKFDLCDGIWVRWKHNILVIPSNLFGLDLLPNEEVECLVAVEFAVGGIYFGWRSLGYPSGIADKFTPSTTASVNTIREALGLIRREAEAKGVRY